MGLLDKLIGSKATENAEGAVVNDDGEYSEMPEYERTPRAFEQYDIPDFTDIDIDEINARCMEGDSEALYLMGHYFLNVQHDNEQALACFKLSADKGCVKSMYEVGVFCELGRHPVEKDEEAAWKLYHIAAKAGYEEAIYYIANC